MPKESAPLTPEQEALFGELYTLRSGAFVAACDGDEDYWWRAEGNARDMGLWQSRGHMAAEPNLLEEALRTREALRARLGALLTADQTERLDRQQRYLLASPWWC